MSSGDSKDAGGAGNQQKPPTGTIGGPQPEKNSADAGAGDRGAATATPATAAASATSRAVVVATSTGASAPGGARRGGKGARGGGGDSGSTTGTGGKGKGNKEKGSGEGEGEGEGEGSSSEGEGDKEGEGNGLYDTDEDDDNEKWVADNLGCGDGVETDAHLSCPCCFTLLCVDCQQHEVYHTQYRAMFVRNCKVDRTQTLTYADNSEPTKTTTAARSTATTVDDGASGDTYHPVLCANCGLEVGVFDKDELYHFFNVIPS